MFARLFNMIYLFYIFKNKKKNGLGPENAISIKHKWFNLSTWFIKHQHTQNFLKIDHCFACALSDGIIKTEQIRNRLVKKNKD